MLSLYAAILVRDVPMMRSIADGRASHGSHFTCQTFEQLHCGMTRRRRSDDQSVTVVTNVGGVGAALEI
jgi:hypothetical protein